MASQRMGAATWFTEVQLFGKRESWVCLNQVIYPDGLSVVTAAQVLRKYDINTSQELRTKRAAAFEAPSWRRGPEWMRVVEL